MQSTPTLAIRSLARHHETTVFIAAPVEAVFSHIDDHRRLASHMDQSSWMMGVGRMKIELDDDHGQKVGSRIRVAGRILGFELWVDEVVISRDPPYRKAWETTVPPKLLIIGHYRMGFELTPKGRGTLLRVFIDYEWPKRRLERFLAFLFARAYARWCTRRMANDTAATFA
jgi:hypothetical protein